MDSEIGAILNTYLTIVLFIIMILITIASILPIFAIILPIFGIMYGWRARCWPSHVCSRY